MQKTIFKTRLVTEFQLKADYDANGPWETLGELRWVDNKCYRWVLNEESATDLVLGYPVCHDLSGADNAIENGVLLPVAADLGYLAGIAISAIPFGGCGWIQVSGYCASVSVNNSVAADFAIGDYLKGVNAATYMRLDAATQPLYKRNVQILEVVASSSTTVCATTAQKCLISCLD